MTLLNSRQAAELIAKETGRSCTRQNVDQYCRPVLKLPLSCKSVSPVRLDSETLVAEYLAVIDKRQAGNPLPGRPRPAHSGESDTLNRSPAIDGDIPDYNDSRARSEHERANLLELERRKKEGELIERAAVERADAELAAMVKTKLLGVPARAKQRIPHLSAADVDVLMGLQREALEEISGN